MLGWLKVLHEKATLPDDWSRAGTPDPRWDSYSTVPMLSWARFDLIDSAYALAVIADRTPAWRELYVRILDGFLDRYTTWWGALDWMTLKGADPRRAEYPKTWRGVLIPEEVFGDYNAPGYTGDGLEPWGSQPDPIGADGNLFYKGFLALLLGLRARISGEDRWTQPFPLVPDMDGGWIYTHEAVTDVLTTQWASRPKGCHCENTKIWPYCLAAAGLGLKLADAAGARDSHWVFDQWFAYADEHEISRDADGAAISATIYRDPIRGLTMSGNHSSNSGVALYLAPQRADVAADLSRAVAAAMGWSDPGRPVAHVKAEPRLVALGRIFAREFGDDVTAGRLDAFADELEPTWTEDGSFFFGFGLDEEHPRGQPNATMMLAEVIEAPGQWAGAFAPVGDKRFREPTVERVDFPTLGISQARYDPDRAMLAVSTYMATPTDGNTTTFAVTGLGDASHSTVSDRGRPYARTRVIDTHTLSITCSAADHQFAVTNAPQRT